MQRARPICLSHDCNWILYVEVQSHFHCLFLVFALSIDCGGENIKLVEITCQGLGNKFYLNFYATFDIKIGQYVNQNSQFILRKINGKIKSLS